MNLSALLASLLQPLILRPVQKAGIWATRQIDGKTKGNAQLAADQPVYDAVENSISGAVAGSLSQAALSQVGAAHLTTDKSLGIPTTEEGLLAAGAGHAGQTGTLNLSDPAAALSFLAQNLVK